MYRRGTALLLAVPVLAVLAWTPTAAAGEPPTKPTATRQAELMHRLKHDCGSCHGMTLKGGLGPALLPAKLAERSDEELVEVILEGRPGTPMPPWDFEIPRAEAAWLVRQLRKGLDHGQ